MRVALLKVGSLAAGALMIAAAAGAQKAPQRGFVSVAAHDSSGAAIPAAEVTVTRNIKDVVAHGMTDSAGHVLLGFDVHDSTDMNVVIRKIGYPRSDYFFAAGPRDTAIVQLVIAAPKGNTLDAVKVTAKTDLRYKSYHVDADDIEKTDIPLWDAWDVVKRLRPDMLTSRGGCDIGIQDVWVNGKRIVLPLPPTREQARFARAGVSPRARYSYIAVSVLSEIPPEHIQEMNYRDCFDSTLKMVGSQNALFITLKPGIGYQRNVGSFVDDTYGKPEK